VPRKRSLVKNIAPDKYPLHVIGRMSFSKFW
jgi:hypothetical protein